MSVHWSRHLGQHESLKHRSEGGFEKGMYGLSVPSMYSGCSKMEQDNSG